MIMKVGKEDLSKILARADITETTQWLSVKKRKRGVFILFQALVKRLSSPAVGVFFSSVRILKYLHIFHCFSQYSNFPLLSTDKPTSSLFENERQIQISEQYVGY